MAANFYPMSEGQFGSWKDTAMPIVATSSREDNDKSRPTSTAAGGFQTFLKAMGGNLSSERKRDLYYGKPPKNAYFGFNTDIAHIHEFKMSPEKKAQLYGIGQRKATPTTPGELLELDLETTSAKDLAHKLAEETNLTLKEAKVVVGEWMRANGLTEANVPGLGKEIVAG